VSEQSNGLLDHQHFALRRLHSLTGIVPIGAFLINHLLTNSMAALNGMAYPADRFDEHVHWIHSLPWLLAIEVLFIFLPLAFHAFYGALIAWQGKVNQNQYPYLDNWRYTFQRTTAWITLAFVIVHLGHFRFAHWLGAEPYHAGKPYFFAFTQEGFSLWLPMWAWMVVYAVGLTAAVFHFCNGLVTFCITWGIVIGDSSRKRMSLAAGGLGAVLMIWGVASLWALGTIEAEQPAQDGPPAPLVQELEKQI
jgi:succinate dehydrogenase / fumarate reductase cytochrome b subunit